MAGAAIGAAAGLAGSVIKANAADAASSAASADAQAQIKFQEEQLAFQKQQYGDWKNIYGDLQANLGDYYKNLTPNKLEAMGLQNQADAFNQASQNIRETEAQRGLAGSGQENASLNNLAVSNAEARASIRTNAPMVAAQQKLQFLGVGLNQGTTELGIISNQANTVNNAQSNQVNALVNTAGQYLTSSDQLLHDTGENAWESYGVYKGANPNPYLRS